MNWFNMMLKGNFIDEIILFMNSLLRLSMQQLNLFFRVFFIFVTSFSFVVLSNNVFYNSFMVILFMEFIFPLHIIFYVFRDFIPSASKILIEYDTYSILLSIVFQLSESLSIKSRLFTFLFINLFTPFLSS